MSDHIQKTIAELEAKLKEQERTVSKTKMLINQLCEISGQPARFSNPEDEPDDSVSLAIRSDQFYGQPLAACIRTILELRRKQNQGPVTVNELYKALMDGGYAFETKVEDNAKRGLRISLSKNTAAFHKLPNGKFGLTEWYPNAKTGVGKRVARSDDSTGSEILEDEESEEQETLLLDAPETSAEDASDLI